MKIWPWSEIAALKRELRITQAKLDACGLAAAGAFHMNATAVEQSQASGMNAEMFSPALAEIIKLRTMLDSYPEPPPYVYRNKPRTP